MNMTFLGPGQISFGTSEVMYDVESGLIEINDPAMINLVNAFENERKEITIEMRLITRQMWLLLTGRKVSNNWLKMHGGIMQRKSYKERKKT